MPLVHQFETVPDVMSALESWRHLPGCLLMESSRLLAAKDGKPLGRYSFLMADPIESLYCHEVAEVAETLDRIDSIVSEHKVSTIEELPPMQGGVAGFFSYDLSRAFEKVPLPRVDEFQSPLIAVGVYDVVLAWDHETNAAWLISHDFEERAESRLNFFSDLLEQPVRESKERGGENVLPIEKIASQYEASGPEGLTSNFSREDYLAAVARAIDYIHDGDIFQVNIAHRLLMEANCDSVELYRRLRNCNPAPFGGYFDYSHANHGSGQLVSASPERLVSVRNGLIETRPIKGTRIRTGRPMVDIHNEEKLSASEKDRAENTMIVDLMRNDLSRICTDDSVRVTQLCEIENYRSVMHLVSAVEGRLKCEQTGGEADRCRPSQLLKAIFPGGSITGAPKVRAMEIIAELEPTARGAYCGSMGYFGCDGSADLNILIRTITASHGWWQIPVGGGIVSQSQPENEYEETWTKAAGMLNACADPAKAELS